jgi:phosphoribosyl-ATP pyrophosphohydrolase/phosphoribosyl-AMP cyclohydrolase
LDKLLIPCIYLKNEKAVSGFGTEKILPGGEDPAALAGQFGNTGADEVLVFDLSEGDGEHDRAIGLIKKICEAAEVPVTGAGNVKRMEDVKKLLYAGCRRAVLNFAREGNREILKEVSGKFGKDRIVVRVPDEETFRENREAIEELAGMVLCDAGMESVLVAETKLPLLVLEKEPEGTGDEAAAHIRAMLGKEAVQALTGANVSSPETDLMAVKHACRSAGIPVNAFESRIAWEEFKLNSDGLIPCIVQDYRTDEVLMLAYMNEEAFRKTLETGKMTYWSRSRQELWTKGLTSGHLQYVKSLTLDCDNDTILAKVSQVGAACHTGSRTCFFRELMKKEYDDTNPLRVFEDVFAVIKDRKIHPKEGSYTNYLFEKGIDKILKKVGEECTEIVIAAKNPDKEEIKYEISDFLYHVMVLMAEKGVSWEDITRELARR